MMSKSKKYLAVILTCILFLSVLTPFMIYVNGEKKSQLMKKARSEMDNFVKLGIPLWEEKGYISFDAISKSVDRNDHFLSSKLDHYMRKYSKTIVDNSICFDIFDLSDNEKTLTYITSIEGSKNAVAIYSSKSPNFLFVLDLSTAAIETKGGRFYRLDSGTFYWGKAFTPTLDSLESIDKELRRRFEDVPPKSTSDDE